VHGLQQMFWQHTRRAPNVFHVPLHDAVPTGMGWGRFSSRGAKRVLTIYDKSHEMRQRGVPDDEIPQDTWRAEARWRGSQCVAQVARNLDSGTDLYIRVPRYVNGEIRRRPQGFSLSLMGLHRALLYSLLGFKPRNKRTTLIGCKAHRRLVDLTYNRTKKAPQQPVEKKSHSRLVESV
jgi:hypothetical protein